MSTPPCNACRCHCDHAAFEPCGGISLTNHSAGDGRWYHTGFTHWWWVGVLDPTPLKLSGFYRAVLILGVFDVVGRVFIASC